MSRVQVFEAVGAPSVKQLFPGQVSRCKAFRTCTHVFLVRKNPSRSAGPSRLVLSNMHIVSGTDHRAIPGENPEARTAFKQSALTAAILQSVRITSVYPAALAAAQSSGHASDEDVAFVLAGDMNLGAEEVVAAIEDYEADDLGDNLFVHHAPEHDLLPL